MDTKIRNFTDLEAWKRENTLYRYLRVWGMMTTVSIQIALNNRLGAGLFICAKLLRFAIFFFTIVLIVGKTQSVAGFSQDQVLLVFFVFTLVDTISQMLFREVYRFRPRILSGDFDLDLVKPMPSLLRPLLGGADPLDMITLIPLIIGFVSFLAHSTLVPIAWIDGVLFLLLVINAVIISASFHILVLALGVISTEVDHAIMLYRDLWNMGRFPTRVYGGVVRLFLSTLIPIASMVTVPVLALSGTWGFVSVLTTLPLGGALLALSIFIWNRALSHYTSAST